jgi:Tfp pilus assembly protein PilX
VNVIVPLVVSIVVTLIAVVVARRIAQGAFRIERSIDPDSAESAQAI